MDHNTIIDIIKKGCDLLLIQNMFLIDIGIVYKPALMNWWGALIRSG